MILIANDITHKAGSFGTKEDVVFKLASEFAREKRIPRLYIAANSGARIGLADSVKKKFKVSEDTDVPAEGLKQLCDAALVRLERDEAARRPQTTCFLTDAGRVRFVEYLNELQRVVGDAQSQMQVRPASLKPLAES